MPHAIPGWDGPQPTLSLQSIQHPALALPTGDLAEAPRLGQDWSPCAASVVICGGHFLLPIHVSHSTASRGGTSEPQRVPIHSFSSYPLPCRARSRAGPFGLGPPSRPHLCGACTACSGASHFGKHATAQSGCEKRSERACFT